MKIISRIMCALLCITLALGVSACSNVASAVSGPVIDYADAESFEAALNKGENLEGKIVRFEATDFQPQSALGYNIWAGEHLNFISDRNPDVKAGDVVTVKTDTIKSALGSWIITYEMIDNAVIGDSTISKDSAANADEGINTGNSNKVSVNQADVSGIVGDAAANGEQNSGEEIGTEELSNLVERVDSNIVAYVSYGNPYVSAYSAFKNNSDVTVKITDAVIEFTDEGGNLLTIDSYPDCIPEVIKPGQIGYVYTGRKSLEGIDITKGLAFKAEGVVEKVDKPYEIEVSDIVPNITDSNLYPLSVVGRGTNNSDRDVDLAKIGVISYDKDGKVIGLGYTFESFAAGQTKAFEYSGNLMSSDYSGSMVDSVEVYIQGEHWF